LNENSSDSSLQIIDGRILYEEFHYCSQDAVIQVAHEDAGTGAHGHVGFDLFQ